jgi:hypothetical protein
MQERIYVGHANIAYYKELLAAEIDPRKVAMIRRLLAKEEAKLADWQAENPKARAAE